MSTSATPTDGNKFKHHRGGVVQVQHVARFGLVPESLLEDDRLDIDTRAVAAWLAIKQHGWQISIDVLRRRLMLGKERWKRIAGQLEAAKYLSRQRLHGPDGLWVWENTFTPVPGLTMGGLAAYGPAASGGTADGSAMPGKPGHNVLPPSKRPIKKKTTTTTVPQRETREDGREGDDGRSGSELVYPTAAPDEIAELQQMIAECPPDLRQGVLDELEGNRRAGSIKSGITRLAKALIKGANEGRFRLGKGRAIQAARARCLEHEAALAQAASLGITQQPSLDFAEQWFPNRAREMREKLEED